MTQRGKVNEMQVWKYENLMGQEGSEYRIATAVAFDSSGSSSSVVKMSS
jgi:hypothetical protein